MLNFHFFADGFGFTAAYTAPKYVYKSKKEKTKKYLTNKTLYDIISLSQ